MNKKNYIWDFDGTLYDTYPAMVDGAIKAMNELGVSANKEEVYRTMKKYSTRQLILDYQLNEQTFTSLFHYYEMRSPKLSQPFAGTENVLKTLKKQGATHFILTHRLTESTWKLLEKFGLSDCIKEVVGIDRNFPRKPAPDALNDLIKRYQLKKSETIMIGDRSLDIEAGKNAGIATCLFDSDHFIENTSADYTVNQVTQILDITEK